MKILSLGDLVHNEGWIAFEYEDGSLVNFRTTENSETLASVGGSRDGYLYQLDKGTWFKIPDESRVKTYVTDQPLDLKGVAAFANRFI